ncbi:MAG TPA: hypothetical protein VG838_06200 [Opitutaceae bacterium]|nr:hypothetical protein [Opitutaceae bacterium]
MKPESDAWKQLEEHAAAHLRSGFATRVLRAVRPCDAEVWSRMEEEAAGRLRAGFADRVLRAVRSAIPAEIPSFSSQFALSAATLAICLAAVVYVHDRNNRLENERNLADWERLVADAQDLDSSP